MTIFFGNWHRWFRKFRKITIYSCFFNFPHVFLRIFFRKLCFRKFREITTYAYFRIARCFYRFRIFRISLRTAVVIKRARLNSLVTWLLILFWLASDLYVSAIFPRIEQDPEWSIGKFAQLFAAQLKSQLLEASRNFVENGFVCWRRDQDFDWNSKRFGLSNMPKSLKTWKRAMVSM